MLLLTVTGCASAVSEGGATELTLDPLETAHAAALAGCDVDLNRQTGRALIPRRRSAFPEV